MKAEDIKPGSLVLIDDVPHLIEEVAVTISLTAQRIQSYRPPLDDKVTYGPIMMRMEGKLDDPKFSEPRMRLLVPQGDCA